MELFPSEDQHDWTEIPSDWQIETSWEPQSAAGDAVNGTVGLDQTKPSPFRLGATDPSLAPPGTPLLRTADPRPLREDVPAHDLEQSSGSVMLPQQSSVPSVNGQTEQSLGPEQAFQHVQEGSGDMSFPEQVVGEASVDNQRQQAPGAGAPLQQPGLDTPEGLAAFTAYTRALPDPRQRTLPQDGAPVQQAPVQQAAEAPARPKRARSEEDTGEEPPAKRGPGRPKGSGCKQPYGSKNPKGPRGTETVRAKKEEKDMQKERKRAERKKAVGDARPSPEPAAAQHAPAPGPFLMDPVAMPQWNAAYAAQHAQHAPTPAPEFPALPPWDAADARHGLANLPPMNMASAVQHAPAPGSGFVTSAASAVQHAPAPGLDFVAPTASAVQHAPAQGLDFVAPAPVPLFDPATAVQHAQHAPADLPPLDIASAAQEQHAPAPGTGFVDPAVVHSLEAASAGQHANVVDLGMGLGDETWRWDLGMGLGDGTGEWDLGMGLGMGLGNGIWGWDLGMGLGNEILYI